MTQQTLLELSNPFDAYARKLGYCVVMVMTIGSNTCNPSFLVKLYGSGKLRTVDQNDLLVYGNPGAGESLQPDIPESWLADEDKVFRVTNHKS